MPAGTSEICATVNGKPGRRTVIATREACERLQADLQDQLRASAAGEKARPMLMFDHRAGNAAAKPLGFEWDEKRGILLRVEWTQAGREAVEGGNYGYISPVFNLSRSTGEIIGLSGGVEVGSLVNDPAFERNECIAASRVEEPEQVTVEYIEAANPWGCNQHGHREGHQGGSQSGSQSGSGSKHGFFTDKERESIRQQVEKLEKKQKENPQFKFPGLIDGRDVINKIENKKRSERESAEAEAWLQKERGRSKMKAKREDWIAYYQHRVNEEKKKAASGQDADVQYWENKLKFAEEYDEKSKEKVHLDWDKLLAAASVPPRGQIVNAPDSGHNELKPATCNKMDEQIKKTLGLAPDADEAAVLAAIRALKASGAEAVTKTETLSAECEQHKKALAEHKEKSADSFVKRLQKDGTIAPHDEERAKAARTLYMTDPEQAEVLFCGLTSKRAGIYREEVKANRVPARSGQVDNYKNMTLEELLNDN